MKFDEILKGVKDNLKNLMTKEGVDDTQLEDYTQLMQQVDDLGKQHQELVENHSKMKDKYIEAVVNYGTKTTPKDDVENDKPKTFEEIASEVLSKEK